MVSKFFTFIFTVLLCGCLPAGADILLGYSARIAPNDFRAGLSVEPTQGLSAGDMYSVMQGMNKYSGNKSEGGMHFGSYGAYVSGRRLVVGDPSGEIGTTYFGFDLTVAEGFAFNFTSLSFSILAPQMISGGVYIDIRSSVDSYVQSLGYVLAASGSQQTVRLDFFDVGSATNLSNINQPVTFRIYTYKHFETFIAETVGIVMTDFTLRGNRVIPEPAAWAILLALVSIVIVLRKRA